MTHFHFTYDPSISLEQRLGFEFAAKLWAQFLLDDVTINLHIVATDSLNNGQAVGGAIPLFHEQNYGVYQEYVKQDTTSEEDDTVIATQQDGNTVDVLIGDEVVDGNSTIMLTSAQAKALGMEEGIELENGSSWERDLVDSNALDGYILINNSFDWSYDFTRQDEGPANTLDFLTMALHEIGHTLGFVSGLDGLLDVVELYSGETQAEGFTPLDLLRYTDASQALDNPDGQVADLTVGADAHFSLDGENSLATFSTGQDKTLGGDGYQASHWERFRNALGIMDPTLAYQERTDISQLDLQAFDVLGWDINYDILDQGLDLQALYHQALEAVADDFGIDHQSFETAIENGEDSYTLGYSRWWQDFADHMAALGYSRWWQDFEAAVLELGYSRWWQALEQPMQELGYSRWWQGFEDLVSELGYSRWWQDFENDMLDLGYSRWWQGFETEQALSLGYSRWWQDFEDHMSALGYSRWWQDFEADVLELGYSRWWQALDEPLMELGYSRWWQALEDLVIELGYSRWWQELESDMLELGYSRWWQGFEEPLLELGYSRWWQELDPFLATLEKVDSNVTQENTQVAGGGVRGGNTEIFYGGEEDDIIAGDKKQDRINAGDGDDLIDGKAGHDVLWGEGGRDLIYGQQGNDLLYGGADDDLLLGEEGEDELHGETGHDILSGGQGHDILSGGDGRDDLKGGTGHDVLSGDAGNDRLDGEMGNDIVIGGEGRDQVDGRGGNDFLYGDTYVGEETLNQLRAWLKQQPIETTQNETVAVPTNNGLNPIRLEAEDMSLTGDYDIRTSWNYDSGDTLRVFSTATATTTFNGLTGNYMVVARYFDKKGGYATLDFTVNSLPLNQFTLDQETNQYYTQTISQNLVLSPGDVFSITATADGSDNANLDYLEFVPLDNLIVTQLDSTAPNSNSNNASLTTISSVDSDTLRVEAESMTLIGDYSANGYSFASNGQLIELSNQGQGKALTTFTGETGFYNIVVGHHDENDDGIGQISAFLDGIELDHWHLDQNLGNASASLYNFTTRTVASGIALSTGDIFELVGLRGEGDGTDEAARIDYVEFIKVDAPTLTQSASAVVSDSKTVEQNLVAHWTFDEARGVVAADQTGVHPAILTNTVTNDSQWSVGAVDGALQLDGVNDYVAIANSDDINLGIHGQRTISLWFQVDDATISDRKQVIYEEGGTGKGLNIYIHNGTLYIGGWNTRKAQSGWAGTFLQTDDIMSDEWHHIALVLDGNNEVRDGALTGYLDGEVFGVGAGSQLWKHSGKVAFGAVRGASRFHDGIAKGTGDHGFTGRIDEAYLYNQALDADEIGDLIGRDNDRIQGGAGNDTAVGGPGNDVIYGETKTDTSSFNLSGSQSYDGHTYLLSAFGTWEDAQAEARRLGGNLVTINDASEENWLRNTFGSDEILWLGFSDAEVDGQWGWVSGETVTYTNWGTNEGGISPQDYGVMNFRDQWDDAHGHGTWDAGGQWLNGLRGIIEINTSSNDLLVGGIGKDTLYGNAGDDTLYGDELPSAQISSEHSTLTNGLVGYWAFDETSGSVASDATRNHAGTLTNMTSSQWSTGQLDGALTFDGYNDRVMIADSNELDITNTLTLATWVKADTFDSWNGLIVKGTSEIAYGLDLRSDGRLIFLGNYGSVSGGSGSGQWSSNTALTSGKWHHVALTYDGNEFQFYLDGQLDGTHQANITFGTNHQSLVLGADVEGRSYFDGALDDARVYNRALSTEEIRELVDPQNTPQNTNIINKEISFNGGSDRLIGGVGNDTLMGGAGNDILNGTDDIAVGFFETDTLEGGTGADTFILGEHIQPYYQGMENRDYALIKDFNSAEDRLQLHGSASDYRHQQQGADLYLYHDQNGSDLVAIFEQTTTLNLSNVGLFL